LTYACERCGEAFLIPAGSTPRRSTTAASIAGDDHEHFVIPVGAMNRYAIDPPDQQRSRATTALRARGAAVQPRYDRRILVFGAILDRALSSRSSPGCEERDVRCGVSGAG
jgi:hypothetical protein